MLNVRRREVMRHLVKEEKGATTVEYALLIAAISVAAVSVVIVAFSSVVIDVFLDFVAMWP